LLSSFSLHDTLPVFAGLPVAAFLLANRDGRALRRYVWLWGWLAFLAAASAWAVLAWRRYPDIVELWKSDYVGRDRPRRRGGQKRDRKSTRLNSSHLG